MAQGLGGGRGGWELKSAFGRKRTEPLSRMAQHEQPQIDQASLTVREAGPGSPDAPAFHAVRRPNWLTEQMEIIPYWWPILLGALWIYLNESTLTHIQTDTQKPEIEIHTTEAQKRGTQLNAVWLQIPWFFHNTASFGQKIFNEHLLLCWILH